MESFLNHDQTNGDGLYYLRGLQEVMQSWHDVGKYTFQNIANKKIGEALQDTGLINMYQNFEHFSNQDFRDFSKMLDEYFAKKIERELEGCNRFFALIELVRVDGILSKRTLELISTIKSGERRTAFLGILGETKMSLEFLIDSLLLDKDLDNREGNKRFNLKELLEISDARVSICQYTSVFPDLDKKMRSGIRLSMENGILLPSSFVKSEKQYIQTIGGALSYVNNINTQRIIEIFKSKYGYEPKDLHVYLSMNDDQRALHLEEYVTIAPTELLEMDLLLNKNVDIDRDGMKKMLGTLMLKLDDVKFPQDIIKIFSNRDNRLSRKPFIDLGGWILFSPFTLYEAAYKLERRILDRDIHYKNDGKIRHIITQEYDEYFLPQLKRQVLGLGYNCLMNFDMSKDKQLSSLVYNKKKFPHEMDLCWVSKDTLNIIDLKNFGRQSDFYDIHGLVKKIKKEKSKLNKLKDFIRKNESIFFNKFGKFRFIKFGIVTVESSFYEFSELKNKDDIWVDNIKNFSRYI